MTKLGMVLITFVPAVALAQAKDAAKPAAAPAPAPAKDAAKPAPPPMPAPPAEVKQTVDAFKGNWKFDATMSATGMPGMEKPVTAKMTMACKAITGGTAVACDGKMKTPMGPWDGHFVIAYDPYSKAVHFIGITNSFEVHDHICKWASPAELTCTPLKGGMGPGGDEITEDVSMKFEKNTMAFTSVSKVAKGGATMTFEGKGKK